MRRNINLQDLSKDHHHTLLLGWKIKQGLKKPENASVVANYISYVYKATMLEHFREEEEILLCHLKEDDQMREQTISEHRQIEQIISKAIASANPTDMLTLADLLERHVRFEERELFPYMEQQLTDDDLEKIGQQISSCHVVFKDTYPNEFWKV